MYDRRWKNLFEALIFFYGQATSMDKSILRNIVDCYQNRNPSWRFEGYNLISKIFEKFWGVSGGFIFNRNTGLYSLQTGSPLNFITDISMRIFWNSCTGIFEKHCKLEILEFPFNEIARLKAWIFVKKETQTLVFSW